MDNKILTLLLAIDKASPIGESVVLEKKELLDTLFPGTGMKEAEISALVKELAIGGYVRQFYEDDKVMCLAALPKGLLIAEETKCDSNLAAVKKTMEPKPVRKGRLALTVFWAAFAGSAAGGAALYLVLRLLGLLG